MHHRETIQDQELQQQIQPLLLLLILLKITMEVVCSNPTIRWDLEVNMEAIHLLECLDKIKDINNQVIQIMECHHKVSSHMVMEHMECIIVWEDLLKVLQGCLIFSMAADQVHTISLCKIKTKCIKIWDTKWEVIKEYMVIRCIQLDSRWTITII